MKSWLILLFSIVNITLLMAQKVEYIPAEYDTIREEVMVKPAFYELIHQPAVLDTVWEKVILREKSRILNEKWQYTYTFTKKPGADTIGGKWIGVKEDNCFSPNPEDCILQIWVPNEAEYDFKEYKTYRGAEWDKEEIGEIAIQVPRIIEIKPERVKRVYVPAEYKTVEKYTLRKRAKRIVREEKKGN